MHVTLISLTAITCAWLRPPGFICEHLRPAADQGPRSTLAAAMGTAGLFLCLFAGSFVAARALISEDGTFSQHRPQFFESLFRFEDNFDFPKYDTIFSSSRTRRPDFHMLGELPSIPGVPKVDVFCDDVKLTVLVGKRAGRVLLTADELQLGDRCYRSHDLPNQHVFAYGVDECGTTRVVSGLGYFASLSRYLDLRANCVAGGKRCGGVHQHTLDKSDTTSNLVAGSFLGAPQLCPQKVHLLIVTRLKIPTLTGLCPQVVFQSKHICPDPPRSRRPDQI